MSLAMPTKCPNPVDPRNCFHAVFQSVGTRYYVWCHRFTRLNAVPCRRYDEHWNRKPWEAEPWGW